MSPRGLDLDVLLRSAGAVTGEEWRLVRRLPGGAQQGSYLVSDSVGRERVLKPTIRPTSPERIRELAAVVAAARRRG